MFNPMYGYVWEATRLVMWVQTDPPTQLCWATYNIYSMYMYAYVGL